MPSIVIFAGVMVVLLFCVLIWTNVRFYKNESRHMKNQDSQSEFIEQSEEQQIEQNKEQQTNETEGLMQSNLFQEIWPFFVNEELAPEFSSEKWRSLFNQLTAEKDILGWIAFKDENQVASDRIYDAKFLNVMGSHYSAMSDIQKEIGLTNVHEMFIRGNEGNVWFIYVDDKVWFALFSSEDTNVSYYVNVIQEVSPSHI